MSKVNKEIETPKAQNYDPEMDEKELVKKIVIHEVYSTGYKLKLAAILAGKGAVLAGKGAAIAGKGIAHGVKMLAEKVKAEKAKRKDW